MDLPITPAAERLDAAMDRLREAHFVLHGMEEYYHFADPFTGEALDTAGVRQLFDTIAEGRLPFRWSPMCWRSR